MHFRKVLTLRGPNIWADYPVLKAWLDLGPLKDSPSNELPGFNERLMAWLPSLAEHRCSVGERGGFFERLRQGTYQGHVLEHVALELQTLAGTPVGFGRTRSTHEEGVYKVVIEYENEDLGQASLEAALRICSAAAADTPVDVAGEIGRLTLLAQRPLASPSDAAVQKATGGRGIPIVAVTGVNGKTTVTRLVSHVLARRHRCVGMTSTEGIYIGGRRVEDGDCSGPQSARTVLADPQVDVAVLETARGGVLRAGLGFDRCDVAIVTNVGEGDHLGLGDIETPEELARVKRVIVDVVQRDGAAVLKADDPLTAGMADHCPGHVVYFCRDDAHPVLTAHRAEGRRAVYVRDGHLILADGPQEVLLVPLARVPLTHGGRIAFQVENCLAAAAATWSLKVPCELIRLGLETFAADMTGSPGRFNLFAVGGATVVLDYGHNAASLAVVLDALAQAPAQRRVAVYSTAGDRRDCDMVRQGELLGSFFDRVILFEDHYLRGRKEGEIIGLFRQGIDRAGRPREVEEVRGAVPAMRRALDTLRPGDLVLLQADTVDESVAFMQNFLAERREDVREITMTEALTGHPPQIAGP